MNSSTLSLVSFLWRSYECTETPMWMQLSSCHIKRRIGKGEHTQKFTELHSFSLCMVMDLLNPDLSKLQDNAQFAYMPFLFLDYHSSLASCIRQYAQIAYKWWMQSCVVGYVDSLVGWILLLHVRSHSVLVQWCHWQYNWQGEYSISSYYFDRGLVPLIRFECSTVSSLPYTTYLHISSSRAGFDRYSE